MTGPEALGDHDLDRLLSHGTVPAPAVDLADRITRAAQRRDRLVFPAPPTKARRGPRRPWSRRAMFAGVIALNLVAASALAAAFGGHDGFRRVSALSAQVMHAIAAVLPHHHHPAPAQSAAHRLARAIEPRQASAAPARAAVVAPVRSPPREAIASHLVGGGLPATAQVRGEPVLREHPVRRSVVQHRDRAEAARPRRSHSAETWRPRPSRSLRRTDDRHEPPMGSARPEASVPRAADPDLRAGAGSAPREERRATLEQRQDLPGGDPSSGVGRGDERQDGKRGWRRDRPTERNRGNGLRRRWRR